MKRKLSIPFKSNIWLAITPAVFIPFIASLFYFILFKGSALAQGTYIVTKIFILMWPAVSIWFIYGKPFPAVSTKTKMDIKTLSAGISTGVAISIVMFGLMLTPLGDIIAQSSERMRVNAESLGVLEHYWSFAIFISLFHSLLEEYYWRWFVYGNLRKVVTPLNAHLFAGAAFSTHHIIVATQFFPNPWGFILGGLVGMGGIIWSVMYERQGTIVGAWISHMIVDLSIMVIGHKILFGNYI